MVGDCMSRVDRLRNMFEMGTRLPKILGTFRLERALARRKSAIHSISASPERFESLTSVSFRDRWNLRNMWNRIKLMNMWNSASVMVSIADNIWLSFASLAQNPVQPKREVDEPFLEELEKYAKELGVGTIGYARLPRAFIFRDKAVLFEHVIILIMEMDKDKIDLAPSEETALMIVRTYDALGIAANELTRFLRDHGYAAHAGHPLGGLVLYPALAELAGLGWHGRHGLLITPEFGPRVRIATIFTSIENLPINKENRHAWVEEFCYASCGRCVRKCPPHAILEKPIVYGQNLLKHIDSYKCFPFFAENHGCSICIKECPFSREDYNEIRESFLTRRGVSY